MDGISVIIVSYNTKDILAGCLDSILGILDRGRNEIIVVDNNSTDGSAEMLREKYPMVRTVFNEDNYGFGRANNQGMRAAKGDLFLLLNSDTAASPGAIEKCVKYMTANAGTGVLGCRLETPDGGLQLSCGRFFTLWHTVFGGIEANKIIKKIGLSGISNFEHLLTAGEHRIARSVDWVAGAFMLLRREVFERTGGFDEKIFLYGEELEWCYRIKKAGWSVVYYPEARITHIGKASGASLSPIARNMKVLSGKHYFLKIHHGGCVAFLHKNLVLLFGLVKLPIWAAIYLASGLNGYYRNKAMFQASGIIWYFSRKQAGVG